MGMDAGVRAGEHLAAVYLEEAPSGLVAVVARLRLDGSPFCISCCNSPAS